MSFFKRLFGKLEQDEGAAVGARLDALEAEAENARPGYVGSAHNKAGDLALKSGRHDRAVVSFGKAIDAFLEDAQREQARSVANKIIRVRPQAIRTLCTLTWLDLAARHQAMALLHLRDYVEAARAAGQQQRAATQIHLMARVSDESEFLVAVADGLDSLNFPKRASEVRQWAREGAPDVREGADLAETCLAAAVRSNDRDDELIEDDFESADGAGDASAEDESAADPEIEAPEAEAASVEEAPAADEAESAVDEADASPTAESIGEENESPVDSTSAGSGPESDAAAEPDEVAEDESESEPSAESSNEEATAAEVNAADGKKGRGSGKSRKQRRKKKRKR